MQASRILSARRMLICEEQQNQGGLCDMVQIPGGFESPLLSAVVSLSGGCSSAQFSPGTEAL